MAPRTLRFHPLLVLTARSALALGFLLAGWIAYWSFLDFSVEVPAPIERSAATSPGGARILFLGDTAPTDRALPYLEKHGYGYPFEATKKTVASFDYAIANLEAPITASDEPWPIPKKYIYKIAPEAAPALAEAGIDAVTLANNHMNDFGERGLLDTLEHLEDAEIAALGAGPSEGEARRGLVVRTPHGSLGVLSYMQDKPHWRLWVRAFALDAPFRSWSGAARLTYPDLRADIERMHERADAVAVVVHWGRNYAPITGAQTALGHAAIDYGADAVIGHHPHWAQPVEMYRGRPIVHSVGNYAFGTRGRSVMRFGMGAALHLRQRRLAEVEFLPLVTQNRIVKYQPRPPRGRRADRFFRELIEGSKQLGADIERRGMRGRLVLPHPLPPSSPK